jgi:hypothetical protein
MVNKFHRKIVNFTEDEWVALRLDCQKRGCKLMFLIHKILADYYMNKAMTNSIGEVKNDVAN